jgi:hypothetical protein
MDMLRSVIIVLICIAGNFCCRAQIPIDTSALLQLKCQGEMAGNWFVSDGWLVRHCQDHDYLLIDNSGLLIYVRADEKEIIVKGVLQHCKTKGYFSNDLCGKIMDVSYLVLRDYFERTFEPNGEFIRALKKINERDYLKPSQNTPSVTTLNDLYNKFDHSQKSNLFRPGY